jgi:GT2 family glycosyltransferase
MPDDFVKYAHPVLINSKIFRKLGGYDEDFIGSQFADIDFVYRTAKAGYKIFFAGSVPLVHHYNKNKSTSALRERVKEENECRFRAKHGFKKKKGYLKRKRLSVKK